MEKQGDTQNDIETKRNVTFLLPETELSNEDHTETNTLEKKEEEKNLLNREEFDIEIEDEENRPRRTPDPSRSRYRKNFDDTSQKLSICCCLTICCCGATAGIIYGIYKAVTSKHNENNGNCQEPLTYSFEVPYVPGGKFCIHNQGQAITVNKITFITNAALDGKPWDTLYPWDATLTQTQNSDGLSFTYTITPIDNNLIFVASNDVRCLTYNVDQAKTLGPIPRIAMNPTSVSIQIRGQSNPVELPINGKLCDTTDPIPGGYRVQGKFTNWSRYKNYFANNIPFDYLNHIVYTPFGFNKDGSLYSRDDYADNWALPFIGIARQQRPYLKTLMEIGGYCSGKDFDELTSNSVAIQNFATNVANAVTQLQMDGMSLNWAYLTGDPSCGSIPNPNNFLALIKALRTKLGPDKIIALDVSGSADITKNMPHEILCEIATTVNHVNIKTYDYSGPWSPVSGFQSPMQPVDDKPGIHSVVDSVNAFRNTTCFTDQQIGISTPTDGHSMYVSQMGNTNGLGQPITGTPPGQFNDGSGTYTYKCIVAKDCSGGNPPPSSMIFLSTSQNPYGNVTKQPWAYWSTGNMVLSCEDPGAEEAKVLFIRQEGLGGITIGALDQDVSPIYPASLVGTIHQTFTMQLPNNTAPSPTPMNRILMELPPVNNRTTTMDSSLPSEGNINLTDVLNEFPSEFRDAFHQAVTQGFGRAFLLALTEDTLTTYLQQHGYSERQIYWANTTIRSLSSLYQGLWFSPAATAGTQLALEQMGFSPQTAKNASNAVGVTIQVSSTIITVGSAFYSGTTVGVVTTATFGLAYGSSYVGNKIFDGLKRFSMFAYNSVSERIFGKEQPALPQTTTPQLGYTETSSE